MDLQNMPHDIQFEGLTITFKTVESEYAIDGFDEDVIFEMINEEPQKALKVLEGYLHKYPKHPVVSHWLGVAHSATDEDEDIIRQLLVDSYNAHPDYLHNRISYALICLNEGNIDLVPDIFNDSWDLQEIYPEKTRFHFLEVTLFHQLAFLYFIEIDDLENASKHLSILKEIHPDKEDESIQELQELLDENEQIAMLTQLIEKGGFGDLSLASDEDEDDEDEDEDDEDEDDYDEDEDEDLDDEDEDDEEEEEEEEED